MGYRLEYFFIANTLCPASNPYEMTHATHYDNAIEQEKRNRNEVNSIYYENIVREKKYH